MTWKEIFNFKYIILSVVLFSAMQCLFNKGEPLAISILFGFVITGSQILNFIADMIKNQKKYLAEILKMVSLIFHIMYALRLVI